MSEFALSFMARNGHEKGMSVLNIVVVLEDGDVPMLCPRHREFLVECRECYVNKECDQETLKEVLRDMRYVPYDQIFEYSFSDGVLRVGLREDVIDSTDWWDIFSISPGEELDIPEVPADEEPEASEVPAEEWVHVSHIPHWVYQQSYVVRYNSCFFKDWLFKICN